MVSTLITVHFINNVEYRSHLSLPCIVHHLTPCPVDNFCQVSYPHRHFISSVFRAALLTSSSS